MSTMFWRVIYSEMWHCVPGQVVVLVVVVVVVVGAGADNNQELFDPRD